MQPAVHELEALATLTAIAAARAGGPPVQATAADAVARLNDAILRSKDPAAAEARGRRMLGWFGYALDEGGDEGPPDAE